VRPDIGRFFENRQHETLQMMMVVHDLCLGQGPSVQVWIDGRELVYGTRPGPGAAGFLRMLPLPVTVTLAFPRGHELPDPSRRAKGPPGARTRLTLRTTADLDLYVRRMIDAAYRLDGA
jgi:hypothetical protein